MLNSWSELKKWSKLYEYNIAMLYCIRKVTFGRVCTFYVQNRRQCIVSMYQALLRSCNSIGSGPNRTRPSFGDETDVHGRPLFKRIHKKDIRAQGRQEARTYFNYPFSLPAVSMCFLRSSSALRIGKYRVRGLCLSLKLGLVLGRRLNVLPWGDTSEMPVSQLISELSDKGRGESASLSGRNWKEFVVNGIMLKRTSVNRIFSKQN